ncbi:ACP S-malonyltransferase [Brevibacillus fulvus]|uniref:Malonyl CoA-acyl carrier protein transacylase n=1 Tax=Brevibacillus fulvus TaxID=1125967 RepID=A0A938Y011_9BACL|nr:[acyl-carrier-protein] S-malonyltransferase [Brevibacillus fulvus]
MKRKLVFLFPGQGSQRVQMGLDLYQQNAALRERFFECANETLNFSLTERMFFGTEEELRDTSIAQPAIYVVSMALLSLLTDAGIKCGLVAGHSLGEFTAVAAAGGYSFEEGLRIVAKRGQLMQEAQSRRPGVMAAIVGLSAEQVEEICEQARSSGLVVPANYNSPQQLVISGDEPAVEAAMELARKRRAQKAVRLSVGAAFHSPLMRGIMEPLRQCIANAAIADLSVPLISNADAKIIQTTADVQRELVQQTVSAVRWTEMMAKIGWEHTHFVEIGPGRVLSGLVRSIYPEAEISQIDSLKKLEKFIEKFQQTSIAQ